MGARIRDIRKARGWTQGELAERLAALGLEMHQTTVAKLEAGTRPIRVNEVAALAHIFGVSAGDVLEFPSDTQRAEALRELLLATARASSAHEELQAARRRVADAEAVFKDALAAREALSDAFNALQRAARETEGGDGGERQETT